MFQSNLGLNTDGKLADKWEIPRHHIKVFNILGEGCFGQVWKCEALNIDSKYQSVISTDKKMTRKVHYFWYQHLGNFNKNKIHFVGKEGPTVVAVKMLKENAGEQERSDLSQELQVMKMLDPHPNVVRLLGCCTEKGTYLISNN